MKSRIIFIGYYILMLAVLVSWSDHDNLPSLLYRLGYLIALVTPLLLYKSQFIPIILLSYITISFSGYAVSYMPVDGLYVFIIVSISVLVIGKKYGGISMPRSLLLLSALAFFVDLFTSGDLKFAFMMISFYLLGKNLVNSENPNIIHYFAWSFILISYVLSLEFIFKGSSYGYEMQVGGITYVRDGWMDPNYFGTIIGMGVIASISEITTNKSLTKIANLIAFLVIPLTLYVIFAIASRGAILAIGLTVGFIIFVSPIKFVYKIIFILCILFFVLFMFLHHFMDFLIARSQDTGDNRTEEWGIKLTAFFNLGDPVAWLLGLGKDGALKIGFGNSLWASHNDYIGAVLRFGFIGLIFFLSMLIYPLHIVKENKAIVLSHVLYIAMCCVTLDPIIGGWWPYMYFYLYVVVLANKSI